MYIPHSSTQYMHSGAGNSTYLSVVPFFTFFVGFVHYVQETRDRSPTWSLFQAPNETVRLKNAKNWLILTKYLNEFPLGFTLELLIITFWRFRTNLVSGQYARIKSTPGSRIRNLLPCFQWSKVGYTEWTTKSWTIWNKHYAIVIW